MFKIKRSVYRQFLVSIISDILIVDNAFLEGLSTPMLPRFGKSDPITVSSDQSTLLVNLLYVGGAIGAGFLYFLTSRVGRRIILLFVAIPKITSWLFFAVAEDYTSLCIARFIAGLGHGVTFAVLSIYQCEITSKEVRGIVGTVMSELHSICMLIIFILGLCLSRFTISLIAMLIQTIFFALFLFCPESPYYLIMKKRESEAVKTLNWLLDSEDVTKEVDQIKRLVIEDDQITTTTKWQRFYTKIENRRATLIAIIIVTALSWCGSVPILAYQSFIFDLTDFRVSPDVGIIVSAVFSIIAGFLCVITVHKLGKRLILLLSMPVISLSLVVLTVFFYLLEEGYDVQIVNWIPTVFLVIYLCAYGFSLFPLVNLFVGEIFPFEIKIPAAIFYVIFYCVSSVGTVACYQALLKFGMFVPILFFAIISIIMGVLIYLYVPETEHKTLEDILIELRTNKKMTDFASENTKEQSHVEIFKVCDMNL